MVGIPGDQARPHGAQVLTPDRSHVPFSEIKFGTPQGPLSTGTGWRRPGCFLTLDRLQAAPP